MTDATLHWPALREAVARTAHEHWHALRLIAPQPDPRTIAAETVATAATALIQTATLWQIAALADAIQADPRRALRLARSQTLTPDQLAALQHRLDALDLATRVWTAQAYGA